MVGSPEGIQGAGGAGGVGLVGEVRKQFPEEVATLCWALKSAGGVGVTQGKAAGECPR